MIDWEKYEYFSCDEFDSHLEEGSGNKMPAMYVLLLECTQEHQCGRGKSGIDHAGAIHSGICSDWSGR